MQVVILCGGLATRFREETEFRPKPMVPIGGRPILWHIMKIYAHYGHKEFILCLGYKGEVIKEYFRNYHWNTSDVTLRLGRNPQVTYHNQHDEEDWTVTLLDTGLETQTGGRLQRALPFIKAEAFLFTYGDGLPTTTSTNPLNFTTNTAPSRRSPRSNQPGGLANWRWTARPSRGFTKSRTEKAPSSAADFSCSIRPSATISMAMPACSNGRRWNNSRANVN